MAQVAEMSDANVIHPKNEDSVLSALHALAFVVIGRHGVNGNISDRG